MPGKRHFHNEWLNQTDCNNQLFSFWCVKKNEFIASCKFSLKDINVVHMGIGALKQHAGKKTRQTLVTTEVKSGAVYENFLVKKEKPAFSDVPSTSTGLPTITSTAEKNIWWVKDLATKAEIIAAFQFASQNTPFTSAGGLPAICQVHFPDSVIAKSVSLSATKISYIVSYALSPYFIQRTVKEITEGCTFYTLHFDETLSDQVKKQMDLLLGYWSTKHQEVWVQYCTSIMFGHAKAEEVTKGMIAAMQKWDLPIKYLLFLGMDGLNVNMSICGKLNDKKKTTIIATAGEMST